MILVGDIGGTRTRLAAFQTEGNRLELAVEKTYASQEHGGLQEVLVQFIRMEQIPVHSACFGVAGPVRDGRSKISNLPWTIDSRELASQLKLPSVGLLNDLEAYAYGIDALESKDLRHAERRFGRCRRKSRRDFSAHGTRRGRAVLGRISASSVCLRRRARGFCARKTSCRSNC